MEEYIKLDRNEEVETCSFETGRVQKKSRKKFIPPVLMINI
jgi:hypothetical protein